MDSGLPRSRFGDLYLVPSKNGLMAPSRTRGEGTALVNMREIFSIDRIGSHEMELAPLPERGRAAWLLRPGDLLFARQSLTLDGAGKCSIVLDAPEERTFESHIIRVRLDPSKAEPAFYYYLFRSALGRSLIGSIVEQVAAAGIRSTDLARLTVPFPPVEEQRRIAGVLGSLDDLIDINEQLARSTAQLAKAVFLKRFGSLDPTRGHARGAEVVPFSSTVSVTGGGTPKTSRAEYWGGDIPWFSVVDAPSNDQPWVLRTAKGITKLGLDQSRVTLLAAGATILSARGTVGRVALAAVPMVINQSCYALRSKLGVGNAFAYFSTLAIIDRLRQSAHGSVFDTITRATLDALMVAVPPEEEVRRFENDVLPLMDAMRELASESEALRHTRDELLPLLMSGRVRVRDLEST